MRIPLLLNPIKCGDYHDYHDDDRTSESPTPAPAPRPIVPYTAGNKRQKIPKDAAIFTEGAKVNGPVNYPPYEYMDDKELQAQHRKFQIYPNGNIRQKGPRRIPYNSDKKDFMNKTGRDAFEVFQYQFRVPGDEKDYILLWDYQVGLVRMTALFKCCKYSKTTPAKALSLNPGLREISYSITGGALAAQGYWLPYEAAKAIAATFCYNIRHALTPVFGYEFLSMCIHPKDPTFGKFVINPEIVKFCAEDCKQWKKKLSSGRNPAMSSSPDMMGPRTPHLKFSFPPWGAKSTRARHLKLADTDSEYGTDEDISEKGLFSPEISPRSTTWTTVNRSQSPQTLPTYSPPQHWATSCPIGYSDEDFRAKRTFSKVTYGEDSQAPFTASAFEMDLVSDSGSSLPERRHCEHDLDAAEILLQLSSGDENMIHRRKRLRRGPGS
ncbi:DNA-binding domain of Mlu1-box binding protein MBP1 [Aaosphaeria arxii CBS 175.79]|uniref:DNA-binding domain of Mlu1-box binding protein MBP1 n=1 Tax=Aaosphaeria arxii CBS 175.79 TaxID=1450172 RepID=A0A6A5Y593_9PLEO|nr:DNA-binding domain of Mlu1-box binding protein MBP1 [Aaosphaeria arxii CBS 175.79]KAF2020725.1 DNA-binding domain of Mlu1-box binding protein MBP1 [Aaosphaeria arxii CBS 175.79]